MSKKTVLLGVTAGIAAYKACEIISLLKKKGYRVRPVMSRDAHHFITSLTLETLCGEKAASEMFTRPDELCPVHISLADEADVILVAPATADFIARVAAGICDDILASTICSSRAPVIFAPAMNENMYKNRVIQDKIRYLKEKGYYFVGPIKGNLACGREGMGHLADVVKIVGETEKLLK